MLFRSNDLGCGVMGISYPFSGITSLVDTIVGSQDPFVVGSAFKSTILSNSSETTLANKETIKDNFFQELIDIFTTQIILALTSQPQIRMLLTIIQLFQNGAEGLKDFIADTTDFLKKFMVFIKCMIKEIMNMIIEFIFNLAIGYLLNFLEPVVKKLVKEKIKLLRDTLTSLNPSARIAESVAAAT